jgi:activator of HSP90 ATPase
MPDYKKYYIINGTPEEVYLALTFKPTIELWTGAPAEFVAEVDTEFSLWDGNIVGKNLELIPAKLIRQEWFFGEQENQSIVSIKFHEHKKGTSLELNHTNIPAQDFDEIVDGWETLYMRDLIDFYLD